MDTENPMNLSLVDAIKFEAAKTANFEALLESPVQLIIQIDFVGEQMRNQFAEVKVFGNVLIYFVIM